MDSCFCLAVGVSLIILLKAGILQLTDIYKTKSENTKQNLLREELFLPVRGEIFDRNGVLLATSLTFQTVAMDPFRVTSLSEQRRHKEFETLEKALGLSVSTLKKLSKLKLALIPVKRAVSAKTVSKINGYLRSGRLPGIELVTEQVREYPWGDYTKAVLGVVRGSSDILWHFKKANANISHRQLKKRFPWYRHSSISGATPQRGIGGVEQIFDSWLAGTPDRYVCHLDRHLNPMEGFTEKIENGKASCSIVLSIDVQLQRLIAQLIRDMLVEKEAGLGMAVAMEAFSGEIFAAYSASYDGRKMIADDSQVFTSSFEPGSVAKPLMMLYAFSLGVVDENDRFNCNLPVRIGNKVYMDEHKYTHDLSPREVLAVSSDSGMAQIVRRIILDRGHLLPTDTVGFLSRCGIGERMPIDHTAIPRSALPSPDQWTLITPSQLSIGYEFEVSPFHLVSLYAAFANGGGRPKPILVKRIVDKNGDSVKAFSQQRPIEASLPPPYASLIYDYLKSVVSTAEGTGRKAAIDGRDIAGKTGTARRLVNGRYSRKSHNSTFIGILPVQENSIVTIGVFFQDINKGSHYGGAACAPVFREIAKYIIEKGIH